MKLLIDIGNSTLNWALADTHGYSRTGRVNPYAEDLGDQLEGAWSGLAAPAGVYAVNVGNEETAAQIAAWVRQRWGLETRFVRTSDEAYGVRNSYQVPADLGADRWVALIAAHHDSTGPNCVIDCGTAITLDVVDQDGQHRGGLILPGLSLLCETLQQNTAGIRLRDSDAVTTLLAQGTGDGVRAGARYLLAAALDRIVQDVGKDSGGDMRTIMTGGDAELLASAMAEQIQLVPDLLFRGLLIFSAGEN